MEAETSQTALERRLQGNLISVCKYIMWEVGYSKEDTAMLIVVLRDSTKSNGHKLKYRKEYDMPTGVVGSQT